MTVIEVFADVGCPFTHVGLRRFVARRAAIGRDDVVLSVRAWPLEIVNGAPMDAGMIAEEVDELRRQIAPELFVGFVEAAYPASSLPALSLAAGAYAADLGTGERVSLELRDLLFEQGVDIADPTVLADLAARHGLSGPYDRQRVIDDHEEGIRRGVVGSPHFFTPSEGFFCPALDVSRDAAGALQIVADPDGFERFLEDCFGR